MKPYYEKLFEAAAKMEAIIPYEDVDKRYKENTKYLPRFKERKILDIGCGTGEVPFWYSKQGAYATGLDFSFNAISYASRRAPNSFFCCGDAQCLPFQDKIFDAISFIGSLEHVPQLEKALDEGLRVLKPKGYALILVPNRFFLPSILVRGTDQEIEEMKSLNGWRKLFTSHGLEEKGVYKEFGRSSFGVSFKDFLRKFTIDLFNFFPVPFVFQFIFILKKKQ